MDSSHFFGAKPYTHETKIKRYNVRMSDKKDPKPRSYRVILKTGDHATFINDNYFENFEARLLSGMYGISTATGENLKITPETVARIEEVDLDEA